MNPAFTHCIKTFIYCSKKITIKKIEKWKQKLSKRWHCVRDKKTDLKIAPFKTNLKFALEGTEDKNSIFSASIRFPEIESILVSEDCHYFI